MKKDIVILNEESIAEGYGIGSYLKQYLYCLSHYNIGVYVINFNAKCDKIEFNAEENLHIYNIPQNHFSVELSVYYLSVIRIFKILHPNKDFIFHIHYEHTENLVNAIRKYFLSSVILYTLHYTSWSWKLNGNMELYEKIINKTDGIYDEEEHKDIIENYHLLKRFYDKIDTIIVLCQDSYYLLTKIYNINPKKVRVICNGLIDVFSNDHFIYKDLTKSEFNLLYVGRLDEKKGLIQLLCAFDRILKVYENIRLFIVGNGEFDKFLPYCKSNWSHISFCGRINSKELYELYRKSDIGIISSFSEQCSYVGIEMKMFGLPIVSSNGYGLIDMFNNSNAIIAPIAFSDNFEGYIENLSKSIMALLEDEVLRQKLKIKSREDFLQTYIIDFMIKKYSFLINI